MKLFLFLSTFVVILCVPMVVISQTTDESTPENTELLRQDELRLNQQAFKADQRGDHSASIVAATELIDLQTQIYGSNSEQVARTLEWTAARQQVLSRWDDAIASRERVLKIRKELHGLSDWRYTDARIAYESTHQVKDLEPADRERLNNSAYFYNAGMEFRKRALQREAFGPLQVAYDIRIDVLGVNDPLALATLDALAWQHYLAGNHVRAKSLYFDCIRGRQDVLGNDHPLTAISQHGLAMVHQRAATCRRN